jgi:UPF0716 protein FxsA
MGVLLLFLLLVGMPLLEISVFISVGERIGLWPTLGLVVATAFVGASLLRVQGLAAVNQARESLARDEFPVTQVFDGLCLLVAAALLITPGFVTDGVGLMLFVPAFRGWLRRGLWRHLVTRGEVRVWTDEEEFRAGPRGGGPTVIEGEYREIPPDEDRDETGGDRRGS